jgi:type IV pilus assembly protein PilA
MLWWQKRVNFIPTSQPRSQNPVAYAQILPSKRRHFVKFAATVAAIFLLASTCRAQDTPADQSPETPFLKALNKYPGLLPEFGQFVVKLQQNIQGPSARNESRLLPLLPESTVFYAAFPNYGDVAHQTLKLFRDELQQSSVLHDWWQHGELATAAPKIEDSLEKFYQFHEYLGNEIVVSGAGDSHNSKLLIFAEIRKPGLKNFLQQTIDQFAGKSKPGVRVLDLQELAAAKDQGHTQELIVLVRPDFIVASSDLATLRTFNARLDQHSPSRFLSTPFGQLVLQGYAGGVTVLAAADLHQIVTQMPPDVQKEQSPFRRSGFADMKYLVWDHKTVAGQSLSQLELSFVAPRHGGASWLANSAPRSTPDFASPRPIMGITLALANPAQVFADLKDFSGPSNSSTFATLAQFEKALHLSLKDDLLKYLSGEFTVEVDSLTPQKPAWKAIFKTNNPARLQQTLNTLLAATHLQTQHAEEGGITYNIVTIPSSTATIETAYAFADGHLIVASSRELVADAIHLHRSGESLAKSKPLLANLPPGHSLDASALFFQDPLAMAALQMRRFAPQMAQPITQLVGQGPPSVLGLYADDTTIREASSSSAVDVGVVLVVAAVAIPNLLRSRIAANEASAVGSVRSLNTAQVVYAATYADRGFAANLSNLGPYGPKFHDASPDRADLIDEILASGTKSGYLFRLTTACKKSCREYVVVATPTSSSTGTRSFCSTSDGIIRFKLGDSLPTPASPAQCRAWEPLR